MIVRAVGKQALLVEVADAQAALALTERIRDQADDCGLALPRDVVPAARTVLIDGVEGHLAPWRAWLGALRPEDLIRKQGQAPHDVLVETTYDGDDLEVVAEAWRCSPDEVVRRHQSLEYVVTFCGFAPGFAYCLPTQAALTQSLPAVPRRRVPRERVSPGSVALAADYCGVYPRAMPGGWQVIGHTDAVVFDPRRTRPALLTPGDRVRFRTPS
jgi:allophanate hydrolase subunit 1